MHKAERPSNYFFPIALYNNQAEQIKKVVICLQIMLEIHLLNMVDFIFKVGQLFTHLYWSLPAGTWRQNDVDVTW